MVVNQKNDGKITVLLGYIVEIDRLGFYINDSISNEYHTNKKLKRTFSLILKDIQKAHD